MRRSQAGPEHRLERSRAASRACFPSGSAVADSPRPAIEIIRARVASTKRLPWRHGHATQWLSALEACATQPAASPTISQGSEQRGLGGQAIRWRWGAPRGADGAQGMAVLHPTEQRVTVAPAMRRRPVVVVDVYVRGRPRT